jgi:hypothetical protein
MPNGTIHALGGRCLDVISATPADDVPVILFHCTGGPNQRWRFATRAP